MTLMTTTKQFTDNVHGSICYNGIEGFFIGTPAFNRLHNVLQSSLAYLTYPSNKVKRFEHSIGTMKNSGDIFYYSICNTTDKSILSDFFAEVEREIKEWLNEQNALRFAHSEVFRTQKNEPISTWKIPQSTMYNIYIPADIGDYRNIYLIVFQAIRLCGLLHDIGHLPFSHILESFLKSLYNEIVSKIKKNDREKEFVDAITPYYNKKSVDSKVEIHEGIGIKLFDHIIDNICSFKTDVSNEEWMFLDVVCYVTKQILSADDIQGFSVFKDLHLIVSGVLDADRLDYCNRDLYSSGIKYSPTNNDRLFSGYKLIKVEEKMSIKPKKKNGRLKTLTGSRYYFSPNVKNINEIENLIDLRWKDFLDINFHHRVHKHEILLEEVLKILAKDYFNKKGDNNKLFGAQTQTLPLDVSSIWKLLIALQKKSKIEHLIIQLDDNWLNTLLKQEFFNKYGTTYMRNNNADNAHWNKYHELISAQRHYYSLIKREDDFRRIDSNLFKLIRKKMDNEGVNSTNVCDYTYKDILEKFIDEQYYIFINERGFVFNKVIGSLRSSFAEDLLVNVENELNKKIDDENIRDIMIRKCQFGLGYSVVKEPLYVHSEYNNYKIEQRSRQLGDLQQRQSHLPYFHVYYLPTYDIENAHYSKVNKDALFAVIENTIFDIISDELFSKIIK